MQNKYEKVALQLIEDINTKSLQNLKNHFTPNVSLTVFTLHKGKYSHVKGIDDVIDTLDQNFNVGDARCDVQRIISDGNTVAMSGSVTGTNYLEIENLDFDIKIMSFIELQNGKIH